MTIESRAVPHETEPLHVTRSTVGTVDQRGLMHERVAHHLQAHAGQLSAQATRGCYVGACCIPIIVTTFHVTPRGNDELEVCGCSVCFGIPIPWGGKISRAGDHRFAGMPSGDPKAYQIWDFDKTGNCFCGKDASATPQWWAFRVCCC